MKKFLSICLTAVLVLGLVAGCFKKEEKELVMGFVPHKDGDKLIEEIAPLEEMLTAELGIPVKGFTATNYVSVVEGFGSGQVDFGLIPPFASVLATDEFQAKPILVVVNKKGETTYKSQFLVRKDSGIKSLEDIKGRKVAFVEPGSTSGYLFPASLLKKNGIDLEKDVQYLYSGGHDKSLQLLLNGDVDVATTFVDVRERYAEEFPTALNMTEVLTYTDPIPGISVTVSSKMDAETAEKVKAALIKISESEEGKEMLTKLFNVYGFEETTSDAYSIIRETAEVMDLDLRDQE